MIYALWRVVTMTLVRVVVGVSNSILHYLFLLGERRTGVLGIARLTFESECNFHH